MFQKFCLFLFLKNRYDIYNFYNKNFISIKYKKIYEKYINEKYINGIINNYKNEKWRYIVH
jgi:hypothetical protein